MKRAGRIGATGRSGFRVQLTSGAVVLASVLAACSSSNAGPEPEPAVTASPTTDSVDETTTTTTTTTAPTTTTTNPPPVVNTVSSEPAPETTGGETIPAPTNTMFDPATPEGEVEQATLANLGAIKVCAQQLPNCDIDALTRFSALAYEEAIAEQITEFNGGGYFVRNAGEYYFQVQSLEFADDGTEAIVITCIEDGSQLIAPATDSSPERVVDEGNVSRKDRYLVRRLGDDWFVTAREPLDREAGTGGGFCQ